MLTPSVVLFILFCLYPIIHLIIFSFTNYDGVHAPKFVGFNNYHEVLTQRTFWQSVINTFKFGVIVPALQIPLSLILAVMLNGNIKGRNAMRAVIFLPNITSAAVMGIIFFFMFSANNGMVNEILKMLGLIQKNIDWFANGTYATGVIVLFRLWYGIGFYMILFLAALQKIPYEVYESAAIDGSNAVSTFFKITIPLLGTMFQMISALSILDALKLFDSIKSLTNGAPAGKTEVLTMYIYRYFFEGGGGGASLGREGYASAASVVCTIIIAAFSMLYLVASRRGGPNEK